MPIIKQAAIIGGGVIGAGWIARLIEHGIDLQVYDPAPDAGEKVEAVLKNSRHAWSKLSNAPRCREGKINYADTVELAVKNAELIVESVPERPRHQTKRIRRDREICRRNSDHRILHLGHHALGPAAKNAPPRAPAGRPPV